MTLSNAYEYFILEKYKKGFYFITLFITKICDKPSFEVGVHLFGGSRTLFSDVESTSRGQTTVPCPVQSKPDF